MIETAAAYTFAACIVMRGDYLKAGVSTASLYPMEAEKAFRMLAERGVALTEIFVNTHCELKDPYLSEFLAVRSEYGIKVGSVHPFTCGIEPMMLFTAYERRMNDMLDYYKLFFEFMNKLEADYFILHGNKPQNICKDEVYFERFERLQDTASEFGVTVVQENVVRCTSGSLEFMVKMKETLGKKAKFVLDTKQAHRSGNDPADVVKALGDSIVHMHYSDYGKKGDCLKFGDGDYDNLKLFNELKGCGYKGNAVIELYKGSYESADDLADNYRILERFIKENGFGD